MKMILPLGTKTAE